MCMHHAHSQGGASGSNVPTTHPNEPIRTVQDITYKSADQHPKKHAKPYPICVLPVVPAWLETTQFQKFMPMQDVLCTIVEHIV